MAIRDESIAVFVTVFCDECGTQEVHDYLVPAGVDSLTVARKYLNDQRGWEITDMNDFCPDCSATLKNDEPA